METKPVDYCKECWDFICPALASVDCKECKELNKEVENDRGIKN